MTVVRERIKEELDLLNRATVWLHKQSILQKRTTIHQFAQAIRTTPPKAITVLRYLLNTSEDAREVGIKFQTFVVDKRIPEWLGELLNSVQRTAIIKCSNLTSTVTVRERDMHRFVLNEIYGDRFGAYITEQYHQAESTLYASLKRNEVDVDPIELVYRAFEELKSSDWASPSPRNSRVAMSSHHLRPNGGIIHTNWGIYTDEAMDQLDLDKSVCVKFQDSSPIPNYSEYFKSKCSDQMNKVIDEMRHAGYGVIRIRKCIFNQSIVRTNIAFGNNTDLKLGIRYSTPWVGLVPE